MTQEKMHNAIKERISALSIPTEHLINDIQNVFLEDNNQSIQGIACATWVDTLYNMTDDELKTYASHYKQGTLNPWKISSPLQKQMKG